MIEIPMTILIVIAGINLQYDFDEGVKNRWWHNVTIIGLSILVIMVKHGI